MEHGEEILDLELMDRIDLHDPTAVCALYLETVDSASSKPSLEEFAVDARGAP
jgi:hypothetical protein